MKPAPTEPFARRPQRWPRLLPLVVLIVLGLPPLGVGQPVVPIADPIFCGFWRVRESFELVLGNPSDPRTQGAWEFLRQATAAWMDWRGGGVASAAFDLTEDPAAWWREVASSLAFLPEDVSFSLRRPEEFALVITGSVDPVRWRRLFPAAKVLSRDRGGFAVLLPVGSGRSPWALHVRAGAIFLAPAEFEGNVVDALRSGAFSLSERFRTFQAMVRRRPVLAVEGDLQAWTGALAEAKRSDRPLRLPHPLSTVSTFRLLVEPRMTKAQFFTTDAEARADLQAMAEAAADAVRATSASLASLSFPLPGAASAGDALQQFAASMRVDPKGQSIFLEAEGLGATHHLVGLTALGLVTSIAATSYDRFLNRLPSAGERAAAPSQTCQARLR